MKITIRSLLIWILSAPIVMFSFQNCGQFTAVNTLEVPGNGVIFSSVDKQNVTVQSGEQLARSMASVTEVAYVNSIVNEFNNRRPLMSTTYSIESVNAPMLISIANLGSQYCNEMLRIESAKPAAERKHFTAINFDKGLSLVDEASFNKVLDSLSFQFWGRTLSTEERTILTEAKQEFVQAVPANEVTTNRAQTRGLMLSTCTSMLAALDFIII